MYGKFEGFSDQDERLLEILQRKLSEKYKIKEEEAAKWIEGSFLSFMLEKHPEFIYHEDINKLTENIAKSYHNKLIAH